MVTLVVGLSYIITGFVAGRRRPANRIGELMTVVGYAWWSENVIFIPSPIAYTVGELLLFWMYLPAVTHLVLAYPFGRLRSTAEQVLVIALYGLTIPMAGARYLFSNSATWSMCAGCPNLLYIRDDPLLNGILRPATTCPCGPSARRRRSGDGARPG